MLRRSRLTAASWRGDRSRSGVRSNSGYEPPHPSEIGLDWARDRIRSPPQNLARPGAGEKDFVCSWLCLGEIEADGASASSLFRRGRRGEEHEARRGDAASHGSTLTQPPNPRPRAGSRRWTFRPQRPRRRADRSRPRLSRPCPTLVGRGRSGHPGGAPRGATGQDDFRRRIPDRTGSRVARARDPHPEQRTPQHRDQGVERIFRDACRRPCAQKDRRRLSAPRARAGPRIQTGSEGAARGHPAA